MYRSGWNYKEIAADLGVSEEAIRHVLIGKTWRHIPDPKGPIKMRHAGPQAGEGHKAKLDWESVREIRRQHTEGLNYRQIAKLHGVSYITIRDVVKRQTWRE
jgi:transposase